MAETTGSRTRVLIVDDEVKFTHIVSEFLRMRGYDVAVAASGTEALQQLEHATPDVVLLDLIMPGLSGLDLLKLIRARVFPPRVIIVTATTAEGVTQQTLREGAQAYMCKPVSLDELERLISGFWPPQTGTEGRTPSAPRSAP